jgi:hypothetical protein
LRPLYNARHTLISLALTAGRPPKAIAEYTGTSLAMIQRRYGLCMRDGGREVDVKPDVKRSGMMRRNADAARRKSAPDRIRTCNPQIRSLVL